MTTVSERLRTESRERLQKMTPSERFVEALDLGALAIKEYAAAHAVTPEEARRRLERSGQAGRRYSRVMLGIAG